MSNQRTIAKRYLNFLLERIDLNGNRVNLVGNCVALCNVALFIPPILPASISFQRHYSQMDSSSRT